MCDEEHLRSRRWKVVHVPTDRPEVVVPETVGGVGVKRSAKINAATARLLAEQIISRDIPPGTFLPPEKELAESFGIGRGTMREALRILETFGLIEMKTGRYGGPSVRRPDAQDLSISLTLAFFANGSSMMDVLEARQMLEPGLAELAAERISTECIAELRETIAVMREDDATEKDYLNAAERFHGLVASAAGSSVLSHLSAGLHHIAGGESVGISYSKRERLGTAAAHEAIVEALESGDAARSRELWRVHLSEAENYWLRKFPENAKQPVTWTLGLDR